MSRDNKADVKMLETDALFLRKYRMDDALPLYENWAKDPATTEYMCMAPQKSADDTLVFVEQTIRGYKEPGNYRWVIELKQLGLPIGIIGLSEEREGVASVAYSLGVDYWNRGFGTEALRAVLEFGLREAGFCRIEAYHAVANPASGAIMKNAGMTYEGRARKKFKSNAGWEDSDMYGILAEDIQ